MKSINSIRKTDYDNLWHVVYSDGTYDRVSKNVALSLEPIHTIVGGQLAINEQDIEHIVPYVRWGTFGKDGTSPLKYVRLLECTNDHLEKIMTYQPCGDLYKKIISLILEKRNYNI